MDKKMPIDNLGANKNSVGGNTSPTSSSPAATAVNSPTRRDLLQVGAGLAVAASGGSQGLAAPAIAGQSISVPRAPNIIVLMTDQERHHMHWPEGWAEKNLPSLQRLKRNGLYFQRAYTAACECSPSRGVMVTDRFAPVNRITRTFLWPGFAAPGSPAEHRLATQGARRLRRVLERQVAPQLCLECRAGQRWRRMGPRRH
jgi:hypothetical protein